MVGYFYHLDYLRDDNAAAASAVIEMPESAPAKKTRASMSAPTQAAPPPSPKVHLVEHAKLFAMAVKYQIAALQNLAAQKFKIDVAEHWDHEDLAHAIHVIYTSTAEDVTQLREVVVEVLNAHRDQLLLKPEITTLLRSITGLACDLLLLDSSSATGRRLPTTTSNQPIVCCNFSLENERPYTLQCPSCERDVQCCEGCYETDLENCSACGAEL